MEMHAETRRNAETEEERLNYVRNSRAAVNNNNHNNNNDNNNVYLGCRCLLKNAAFYKRKFEDTAAARETARGMLRNAGFMRGRLRTVQLEGIIIIIIKIIIIIREED